MTTRYRTLQDFRSAKIRARQERDHHGDGIARRWATLQDPDSRGILIKDAVGDAIRSWEPYRRVHDLFHGRISGSTVSAIGMAIANTRSGFVKRIVYSGLSMLLGKVIGDRPKGEEPKEGPGLLSTLASGIGTVVSRLRERKAAREREKAEADPVDIA